MLDSLPPAERLALVVSAVASVLLHFGAFGLAPPLQRGPEPPPAAVSVEIRLLEAPPAAPSMPEPKPQALPAPKPRREPVVRHQSSTPLSLHDARAAEPAATAQPAAPVVLALPTPTAEPSAVAAAPAATAVVVAPAATAASAAPAATAAVVVPPYAGAHLRNSAVRYPLFAQRSGVEGTVQLRVQVLPTGAAGRVALESSSGSAELDAAAVAAVKNWRFEPARRGAEAVEATVIVPIVFQLVRG